MSLVCDPLVPCRQTKQLDGDPRLPRTHFPWGVQRRRVPLCLGGWPAELCVWMCPGRSEQQEKDLQVCSNAGIFARVSRRMEMKLNQLPYFLFFFPPLTKFLIFDALLGQTTDFKFKTCLSNVEEITLKYFFFTLQWHGLCFSPPSAVNCLLCVEYCVLLQQHGVCDWVGILLVSLQYQLLYLYFYSTSQVTNTNEH